MSHEFDSGLFIGTAAWHGLGTVKEKPPATLAEAMVEAKMNWQVIEKFAYDENGAEIPGWKRIIREDTNELFHVARSGWTPIQNSSAFKFFEPLIADGDVELSAAVSLKGGKRVAITAKIKDAVADVVAGDPVEGFLLLFNGHDGKLGLGVRFTNTRVVCNNTLQMNLNAMGQIEGGGSLKWDGKNASIKHTQNINANLDAVQNSLNIHKRTFRQTIEEYRAMVKVQLKTGDFEQYLANTLRSHAKFENVKDLRCFEQLVKNFETGKGMDVPGVAGTAWAAYNAVTEWTTHQRGSSKQDLAALQNRLDANWFGSGASIDKAAHLNALLLATA